MNSHITDELIATLQGIKEGKEWEYSVGGDWLPVPQERNALDFLRFGWKIRLKPFTPEPPEGYRLLTVQEKTGNKLAGAKYWSDGRRVWDSIGVGAWAIPGQHIAVPVEPPAPDPQGWIEWGGGYYPFPGGTLVDVRLRDGSEKSGEPAQNWRWQHLPWRSDPEKNPFDIVAYRIADPAPPQHVPWTFEMRPQEIVWVKEKNGSIGAYLIHGWTAGGAGVGNDLLNYNELFHKFVQISGEPCGTLTK